jgi:predicted GNAT family acetyltransferase
MEDTVDETHVVDNPAQLRYEVHVGDALAGFAAYRLEPGTIVLVHTDVDPAFEGRGLGGRLVRGALDDIRARGLLVVPLCPFAASYVRRHPEYAGLVVGDPEVSD